MTTTAPRRRRHSRTKGRDHERSDRRAGLDILLARADRGTLSRTEAALLREYVTEEQRTADESRKANAGSTRALDRHRAAAEAAIVEAEQRAEQAEEIARAAHQCSNDAERHRAAAERTLDRVRDLAHRMRAGSPMGAAAVYAERIEQALDGDRDALDAQQTAIHAAFADRAESIEVRLAEQKRDHDIALATVEERARRLGAAMQGTADHYRDQAKAAEQLLAAVRAALPDEPRPRLGLPNDLAYANGRHDLAERILYALDPATA
ncbi:hypothetical protein SEA_DAROLANDSTONE_47 [Streptomyces phage Darolandstone]|uniref:Uncharacterized protein n=1 Tax=Streptomyces phage Darolandstone TaxID=2315716 RepID=A0A386KKQ5_9CAUD|nr:hypothetical protein HOU27_gp47 [Streptomyces phage Darolandstone]AYD86235.1 hypothetical protein SEA_DAROLANDSTONE_47 [Streptomyces phage Darolandstone]